MDIKLLSKFKKRLIKIKKEIEKELKEFYKSPNFGDDVDPDEETSETQEIDKQLSLAQTYKARLMNIDSALCKIDEEKYDICEKCGVEISLDVLKEVPESRLCKKCKKEI